MLPGEDGFHICRKIRDKSDVPILFVTAKKEDVDKIKGLSLGADDYIVKPFSPTEMVARLKAHLEVHNRLLGKRQQSADVNTPDVHEFSFSHKKLLTGLSRIFDDSVHQPARRRS